MKVHEQEPNHIIIMLDNGVTVTIDATDKDEPMLAVYLNEDQVENTLQMRLK